jgi:hypothetical protein
MNYHAFSNEGFLLQETLRVARLLAVGMAETEIMGRILEDELFEVQWLASRKTLAQAVLARFKGLAPDFAVYLVEANSDLQRLLVLLLLARRHRLLAELMQELQQHLKLGRFITHGAIKTFFTEARENDLVLAAWTEATYQKSASNILKSLRDSHILLAQATSYEICRPLLSLHDQAMIQANFGSWGLRTLWQTD